MFRVKKKRKRKRRDEPIGRVAVLRQLNYSERDCLWYLLSQNIVGIDCRYPSAGVFSAVLNQIKSEQFFGFLSQYLFGVADASREAIFNELPKLKRLLNSLASDIQCNGVFTKVPRIPESVRKERFFNRFLCDGNNRQYLTISDRAWRQFCSRLIVTRLNFFRSILQQKRLDDRGLRKSVSDVCNEIFRLQLWVSLARALSVTFVASAGGTTFLRDPVLDLLFTVRNKEIKSVQILSLQKTFRLSPAA